MKRADTIMVVVLIIVSFVSGYFVGTVIGPPSFPVTKVAAPIPSKPTVLLVTPKPPDIETPQLEVGTITAPQARKKTTVICPDAGIEISGDNSVISDIHATGYCGQGVVIKGKNNSVKDVSSQP